MPERDPPRYKGIYTLWILTQMIAEQTEFKERGKIYTIATNLRNYINTARGNIHIPEEKYPILLHNQGAPSPVLTNEQIDAILVYLHTMVSTSENSRTRTFFAENTITADMIAQVYWYIFNHTISQRE